MPSSERRHGQDGTESHGKAVLSLPTPVPGQRARSLKLRGVLPLHVGPSGQMSLKECPISCVLPLRAGHPSATLCLLVDSGGPFHNIEVEYSSRPGPSTPLRVLWFQKCFFINFAAERCVAPGFQRQRK